MKDINVRTRISNFFNNIFDDLPVNKRKYYIERTFCTFLILRYHNLFKNDTNRIDVAITNTLETFGLG